MYFFHLYCCRGLDKGISLPMSEKGNGRVQRAPSNLMAALSIELVGVGDQESDTNFSQMLPLGVASHPEWRFTRLQALTPRYHYGMEAGKERPARHVTPERWGLRLLGGECCYYLTMKQYLRVQEIQNYSMNTFISRYFIFTAIITFMSVQKPKARYGRLVQRNFSQQLTVMLGKRNWLLLWKAPRHCGNFLQIKSHQKCIF